MATKLRILADEAEVDPKTLGDLLNGRTSNAQARTLARISRALGWPEFTLEEIATGLRDEPETLIPPDVRQRLSEAELAIDEVRGVVERLEGRVARLARLVESPRETNGR